MTAGTARQTIIIKGRSFRKEAVANAAISPGDLIRLRSDGKWERHGTAKGYARPLFAVESELFGYDYTHDYAANDTVEAEECYNGMEVYATFAAGAVAVTKGDFLESAGDGTLRELTPFSQLGSGTFAVTTEGHAVAVALETFDNSAGGTKVRALVVIL